MFGILDNLSKVVLFKNFPNINYDDEHFGLPQGCCVFMENLPSISFDAGH